MLKPVCDPIEIRWLVTVPRIAVAINELGHVEGSQSARSMERRTLSQCIDLRMISEQRHFFFSKFDILPIANELTELVENIHV